MECFDRVDRKMKRRGSCVAIPGVNVSQENSKYLTKEDEEKLLAEESDKRTVNRRGEMRK